MSKQGLARVLGRAALDQKYFAQLTRNPLAAAKKVKAKLSQDQVRKLKKLKNVDFNSLGAFNKLIKSKLLHATFD